MYNVNCACLQSLINRVAFLKQFPITYSSGQAIHLHFIKFKSLQIQIEYLRQTIPWSFPLMCAQPTQYRLTLVPILHDCIFFLCVVLPTTLSRYVSTLSPSLYFSFFILRSGTISSDSFCHDYYISPFTSALTLHISFQSTFMCSSVSVLCCQLLHVMQYFTFPILFLQCIHL